MAENRNSWNDDRKKEYFSEYRKKRKAALKEKRICPSCEKNPAAENRVCCTRCLEDKKLALKFGTAGPYRQLYVEMFEKQLGLCGICKQPMRRPVLDHCHKTMVVRGLLCGNCNVGLGQFKDDAGVLAEAIKYLSENAGIGVTIKPKKRR